MQGIISVVMTQRTVDMLGNRIQRYVLFLMKLARYYYHINEGFGRRPFLFTFRALFVHGCHRIAVNHIVHVVLCVRRCV